MPDGVWHGVADLYYQPATVTATIGRYAPVDRDLLRDAVRQAEKRRRASFRYCRILTPAEYRLGGDTCLSCASQYHGVVY